MVLITRGYNFSPTELVTNAKLDTLVRGAQITGLSWSDFAGSIIGIGVGTTYSNSATGWIYTSYERANDVGQTSYSGSWSEFNYMLKTPFGKGADVAVFRQNGMETTRLWAKTMLSVGQGAGARADGTSTYSLSCDKVNAFAATGDGNPNIIGIVSHFTAETSTTNANGANYPRITMRGYTPVFVAGSAPGSQVAINRFIWGPVASQVYFGASTTTYSDKILGVCLTRQFGVGAGNTSDRIPCFLFGAPLWRL
jgi:hypothetical protein